MARCKDPSLTFLNHLGYNVVRLPREGIAALDVLGRDGKSLEKLGRLGQIWKSDQPEPAAQPAETANVSGKKSSRLKLSVGLKILEGIVRGMTGQEISLKTAYERARTVEFTFTGVQAEGVAPFEIGRYIASGDLDLDNPFVDRFFVDEDAEAYVISEVLKSKSIMVTARDKKDTKVSLDVPVVQQMVGGEVEVTSAQEQNTDVVYKGSKPLVFGFKVFGLAFANGEWKVEGAEPSGDLAFDLNQAERPVLLGSSGMLRLEV